MSVNEPATALVGKIIEWAGIVERESGDAEFMMRFSDGSIATVAAWKRDGYSLQMHVDLSPNDNPQTDGGASTRRGM